MEIAEAKKREVVDKLEAIQNSLAGVIESAKQGKFILVPEEENMAVLESSDSKVSSVRVKEFSAHFLFCPGSSIEQNKASD